MYRGDSGVVLVTLDGTMRGLNPRTGKALWSMPDPTAGTSESLDDQLYGAGRHLYLTTFTRSDDKKELALSRLLFIEIPFARK
ncbi:hypothetical protein [Streptomyces lavendulae]|uniref:hypothetical protein n=1 Tax=Streptomyces lavendulae TaxID=1914 RepID=UPI0031EF41A6